MGLAKSENNPPERQSKNTGLFSRRRKKFPLRGLIYSVIILIALTLIWLIIRESTTFVETSGTTITDSIATGGDAVVKVMKETEAIAAQFKQGTIEHTFREYRTRVLDSTGGKVEVAVIETTESLARADALSAIWGLLYLGETVTEIRFPVVYRYYVRLSGEWKITVSDHICTVVAPPIEAFLPPAIRTEGMEKHSSRGWARFNAQDQLDALELKITPYLEKVAMTPDKLRMAADPARRAVAELVQNWLRAENHWRQDAYSGIAVYFPHEKPLSRPVISLEHE